MNPSRKQVATRVVPAFKTACKTKLPWSAFRLLLPGLGPQRLVSNVPTLRLFPKSPTWEELAGGGEVGRAAKRAPLTWASRVQFPRPRTGSLPTHPNDDLSLLPRGSGEADPLSGGSSRGTWARAGPQCRPPPTLPCPHILDQSRRAAGALRSKVHWGLSSGVFKKEETKGSEAGPQVRSPAGAAARTTEGNRQVPAELRAPGPAATPASKFRLRDRGSRSGASSGQDPAPPGRAAFIQTSSVQEPPQSWSRGYRGLGVSG